MIELRHVDIEQGSLKSEAKLHSQLCAKQTAATKNQQKPYALFLISFITEKSLLSVCGSILYHVMSLVRTQALGSSSTASCGCCIESGRCDLIPVTPVWDTDIPSGSLTFTLVIAKS